MCAVGDLTGKDPFTHVAMYQSPIAATDSLGESGPPADYRAVPHVTFTDPEIGAVGLSEQAARAAGIAVRVGTARVPETARGWIHKSGGGEVIGLFTLALHAEVTVEALRRMIYTFPTFHRGVGDALRDLGN